MAKWRQIVALLVFSVGLGIAFLRIFVNQDFLFYLGTFGIPILLTLLFCATAYLAGDLLVPRSALPLERIGLSLCLGFGLISTLFALTLLLRLPFGLVFGLFALAVWLTAFIQKEKSDFGLDLIGAADFVPIFLLACGLIMAFLAALTPSASYDVLEYHLPLIRHWLRTGFLGAIDYNFYTLMPSGTEALFASVAYFGRTIEQPAKLMNFALLVTAALLVAVLARRLGASRFLSILAAAAFVSHNTSVHIYVDAFADMGAATFVAGSVLAFLLWRETNDFKWMLASGALAGFALAAKSAVAGIFLAPFVAVVAGFAYADWKQRRRALALVPVVGFAIVAVVAFWPWMIRGFILTRNPFSPFLNEWVHADIWQIETEQLWLQMHGWSLPLTPGHFLAMSRKVEVFGILWLAGTLAALVLFTGAARAIPFLALAGWAVYCLLAHAPDRFAIPLIALMIAATMAAASLLNSAVSRGMFRVAAGLLVLVATLFTWRAAQNMGASENIEYAVSANRDSYLAQFLPMDFFGSTRQLPKNSRILALYEARSFLIDGEHTTNTVFDRAPIVEISRTTPGKTLAEKLKKAGYTHLLVNEIELMRLLATHASPRTAQLPSYRHILQISDPEVKSRQLLQHLEWYLPYERMGATRDELKAIRELTDDCASSAFFINLMGPNRVFLAALP